MVAAIISDKMLTTVVTNTDESKPHSKQLDLVIRTSGKLPSTQTTRYTFFHDNRNRHKIPLSPPFSPTYSSAKAYVAPKREPKKAQITEG
jgi:hypothetical protein